MSPAELREMCIIAAATATVSYVLGYGYEDVVVYDDGPTTVSDVETAPWPIGDEEPQCDTAYKHIATIYEAGLLASLKSRGLGSHRVSLIDDAEARFILDDEKVWAGVEALAAYIADEYDGGFCIAPAMIGDEDDAIKTLKDAGLYPGYWVRDESGRSRLPDAASIMKLVRAKIAGQTIEGGTA